MQARHALQAAAKQFGFDGTERSLSDLLDRVTCYLSSQHGVTFRVSSNPAGEVQNFVPIPQVECRDCGQMKPLNEWCVCQPIPAMPAEASP